MAGRTIEATERAVKECKRIGPCADKYRIAAKYGIAPSTLYRALGLKKRLNGK